MKAEASRHPHEIYCDESGFSGNNLFLDDQPFYVYASVAIDGGHAAELTQDIIREFRIDGNELKGSSMLKFNRGRKAIGKILEQCRQQIKAIVFHKKYNLACKFFEYIFEPVIAEKNSIFYNLGFHKFIANVMYLHFCANAAYAERHLLEFQQFMRLENDAPAMLFGNLTVPNMPPALESIRDFAHCHRGVITEELNHMAGTGAQKWVLDVTGSALFRLLGDWGTEFHQLRVFCDASKPLESDRELFNVMINREDKRFIELEGERHPLTFNLSGPIQLVSSHTYPGVQVADVCAAAFSHVCRFPQDATSQEWRRSFEESLSKYSVWPDFDRADLSSPSAALNALILEEMVARSRNGVDVLEGIEDYILEAHRHVRGRLTDGLLGDDTGLVLPS